MGGFWQKKENIDPDKVVMMCILHDFGEIRNNNHNWINKRYTKIFDEEIIEEQLGLLPFPELKELALEYEKCESVESQIAKDADLID